MQRTRSSAAVLCALAALSSPLLPAAFALQEASAVAPEAEAVAQETGTRELKVEPREVTIDVGETVQLGAVLIGADGEAVDDRLLYFSRSRRIASVNREGEVTGQKPGEAQIIIRERRDAAGENQEGRAGVGARLSSFVRVTVRPPALAELRLSAPPAGLFTGTTAQLGLVATDVNGDARTDVTCAWSSSDERVASVDAFGNVTAYAAGTCEFRAEAEGKSATISVKAAQNPIVRVDLALDLDAPRTGDVVHIRAQGLDASGEVVIGVPIELTMRAEPDDDLGPSATGQIEDEIGQDAAWRFVAEAPGRYTFVATSGAGTGRVALRAAARRVQGKFEFVGQGRVDDSHTSDVWVWEGIDGRDYAVTGTWGANGDAHFWDVTDPANMERISTVTIDARTVNDVKVSEDGRWCVLSREGASNRKNGIVLVDVSDPRNPVIRSGFDDELTGGVHNVFIDKNTVYALSAGARYDSIDVSDPGAPRKIGTYKVARENPSIHDVWIEDGLAYSSNWSDGVHIVDVGKGIAGGSPQNPVKVSSYAYPSGWNHAAFPYRQEATGLFYVAAGDEAFPNGLNVESKPTYPRGWIHFIDFTDLENPREAARYQVPEAGTHNLWIEDDVMYVAYYNAGLRAVDVSGELMGDIYNQGREIAWYLPDDPEGHIANAPMAWGPQPHKGHIFFSDWNSGLWAVKLVR